ncbi:MAG: hypothetical protein JW909_13645 [Planctomycetes bacterium]|nr:hypothetical protein [Planctomycetota bacterium]
MKKFLVILLLASAAAGAYFYWQNREIKREAAAFQQCAAVEDRAKKLAAYENYVLEFPAGLHKAEAEKMVTELKADIEKTRADDAAFQAAADAAGSAGKNFGAAVSAYRGYLAAYPEGVHGEQVRGALENLETEAGRGCTAAVKDAVENPDRALKTCAAYLEVFPGGAHEAEVRQAMAGVEKDGYERCMAAVREAGDELDKAQKACAAYLAAFPEGAHRAGVKEEITRLEREAEERAADDGAFTAAVEAEKAQPEDFRAAINAYEKYVEEYPEGRHAAEARKMAKETLPARMENKAYETTMSAVNKGGETEEDRAAAVSACRGYLEIYPEGAHAAEIKRFMAENMPKSAKAGPWEYSIESFRTADEYIIKTAGGDITLKAQGPDVKVALVGVRVKALRPYTTQEKGAIQANKLGAEALKVGNALGFASDLFLTSQDLFLMYVGRPGGQLKLMLSTCMGVESPRITWGKDTFLQTVEPGKEKTFVWAFTYHPAADRNPILSFKAHVGADMESAARISLGADNEIRSVEYGTLRDMRKHLPAELLSSD